MRKIRKTMAFLLAAVILAACMPAAKSYAAGATEFTSAMDMEFNKLYILKLYETDEYTGKHSYTWGADIFRWYFGIGMRLLSQNTT